MIQIIISLKRVKKYVNTEKINYLYNIILIENNFFNAQ